MRTHNWTYITVKTIVTLFMAGAASISFMHIIDVSHTLGLGWEAWTVPFLVDGFAVLGLIGRSHRFAESTRRAGLKITAAMGLLSLTCNVMAGDNLGQRLYGVLVVGVFVFAEWYSGRLIAAPAPPARTARRCEPGCTCRRHAKATALTPAQKGAITKARKRAERELAEMRDGYVPADAPVSPALV